MNEPDHGELNAAARLDSFKRARDMGLAIGTDVSIASYTYRILSIAESGVMGLLVAEHGHFVSSSTVLALDLRQAGWKKVG